ncbi:hypothetical protein [Nostoc sp. TCL26-01]|uniref:hypothetical protein n=1 Tax=Nostoc sp. TCL26-01 TaxID=2576904 RepID=UPI0015C0B7CD|nr:hypothetical protein [Nostoc sp. TCL26-01]QLE56705.1 hypothetical protein FD725_15045 [Nostoc sp. TCL26-01]
MDESCYSLDSDRDIIDYSPKAIAYIQIVGDLYYRQSLRSSIELKFFGLVGNKFTDFLFVVD